MATDEEDTIALHTNITGPESGDDDDGLDGLGDLVRNHTAQKVEERKEVKVEDNPNTMASVMEQFRKALALDKNTFYLRKFKEHLEKIMSIVLTPSEIGAIFQAMCYCYEDDDYHVNTKMLYETEDNPVNISNTTKLRLTDEIAERIGMFTTQLIQLSYNAGYNDFMLDAGDFKRVISEIGFRLKGTAERYVNVNIKGNVTSFGHHSKYCNYELEGNTDVDSSGTGHYSQYCIFTFKGDISKWDGASVWTVFDSTFKAYSEETLTRLIRTVACEHDTFNKFVLIYPDGTEEFVLQQTEKSRREFLVSPKYTEYCKRVIEEDGKGLTRARVIKENILRTL